MLKYFFLLTCLLSTLNSAYLPFKQNKEFPDDTCGYSYKDNEYVKDCESGKYCRGRGSDLLRCENIPSEIILSSLEESCSSDFECENGLVCTNQKCLLSIGSSCGAGQEIVRTQSGYICKITAGKNYFYTKDFTWKGQASHANGLNGYIDGSVYKDQGDPDYLKARGKITFNETTDTTGKIYEPSKIEYSDIGTVEDGEFVYDELACKSGFALYFYGNSELTNPYDSSYNYMYKKCVTLEEVEKFPSSSGISYCKIKYSLDGKSLTYNVNKIGNAKTISNSCHSTLDNYYGENYENCFSDIGSTQKSNLCRENLKIKTNIFQEYIGALTDDIRKCTNPEFNNPVSLETCQNNQLRKWGYFYDNPNEYMLYYSDEDKGKTVVNFLVQSTFPSYQSNSFLNIKSFIILFLLISLF